MAQRENYARIDVRLPRGNLDWLGRESARRGLSISAYLRSLSMREQERAETASTGVRSAA